MLPVTSFQLPVTSSRALNFRMPDIDKVLRTCSLVTGAR